MIVSLNLNLNLEFPHKHHHHFHKHGTRSSAIRRLRARPVQGNIPVKNRQLIHNLTKQQRNLPARGFRPSYYLFAVATIMTYGMYKAGQGIRERKYVSK